MKRRHFLKYSLTGAVASGFAVPAWLGGASAADFQSSDGVVVGEPTAAAAGHEMLGHGGNAVDAVITAALVAAVVSPHNCGIGGYGGHMIVALARNRKIACIDFNTTAPAAAKATMFPVNAQGVVPDLLNDTGWLAAGVPGTLAGLELGLKKFGTRSFREAVGPALDFARNGFPVSNAFATAAQSTAALLQRDATSAHLYLPGGKPVKSSETFRNPELARLLEKFMEADSAADFYHGETARQIAQAFQAHGGLVTERDLASYHALELKPLRLEAFGHNIYTAPLTAGGFSVLQALGVLKSVKWDKQPDSFAKVQTRLEALRAVWHDRLAFLGDPRHAEVPVARLMSSGHADTWVKQIAAAVQDHKPLVTAAVSRDHGGTVHLSAGDREGNLAALTLTHGNSFGARVTVDGLGLTLGHGMSRFEPKPGHPNSVAPFKRPLDNMCPTIVTRSGTAMLALGGAGGRRIPNAALDVLLNYLTESRSLTEAIAAPRLHCEGDLKVRLEKEWPREVRDGLTALGYQVETGGSARISAVAYDPKAKELQSASR